MRVTVIDTCQRRISTLEQDILMAISIDRTDFVEQFEEELEMEKSNLEYYRDLYPEEFI